MKNVKFYPIIFLFLLLSGAVRSQVNKDTCTYSLEGEVLDVETKAPVRYATVKVKGAEIYAITDEDGKFVLRGLCAEENVIIVSCIGYSDTLSQEHHHHTGMSHIYLKQKVNTLDAVTISVENRKITGTQSTAQKTLKKEDFLTNPTQSLATALSEVDGVSFTSAGSNVQLPVIHGLYGNRILILNNGIKHGFQNWSSDHAPEIDISSASSLTVVKGAAGVQYGPEALGGAIIVESDPLYLNEPFKVGIGTGYQTNGRGYFGHANVGQGFKKWSYHIGGNYTRIGDRNAPDYSLTNSGKEEKAVNAGLRYHHKKLDVKLYYSYVDQNLALLRASVAESGDLFAKSINSDEPLYIAPFSYDINEPNQLTQHHLGKAEVSWWYVDDAKLTLRVGQQLNKRQEYDVRRNVEKPIIDLELTTSDYQLEWKHPDWKGLDGLIGVQLFTQDNNNNPGTGTTPFIPNYNTLRYSAFVIEDLKKGKNTFEVGARLDYEYNNVRGRETNQDLFKDEYSFTNLTSSVGYVRQVSESSVFRSNLGTAWRVPNMAELYSFGQHGFKTSYGLLRYYTNSEGSVKTDEVISMDESNVSPEKGYKFINEWVTEKKKNTLTITGYSHYIENYVYNRPYAVIGTIRGPMPVFIFDQTDALFFGADITWQRNWTKTVTGTYGISYLWSRNIRDNEPLINQPPVTTSYKLVWQTPMLWKTESSKITVKPSYTFQQFQAPRTVTPDELIDGTVEVDADDEIFDFMDAPEGYFLLDLSWSVSFKKLSASVTVQNVFDTSYRDYLNEMRYFADNPGRNILFTLNYVFTTKTKS